MRLRFQTKNILYEVHSIVDYEHMGRIHQRTFYGSEQPLSREKIRNRAIANIKRKFENSSGKIVSVEISAVYK